VSHSIVQLEFECGTPRNPFINAGAIPVTDAILSGHQPREGTWGNSEIHAVPRVYDPSIAIDEAVAASEQRTGFRNSALANYMESFGVLENPVDFTLRRILSPLCHRHVLPAACYGGTLPGSVRQ
jgi:glutaminase